MIGCFTKLGVYEKLIRLRDYYIALSAGVPALAGFMIDHGHQAPSKLGISLAIVSVTINGLPIIWDTVKELTNRRVNVDELISLTIIVSMIQGEFLAAVVVSFVMTFGALIEQVTSESARKAIMRNRSRSC